MWPVGITSPSSTESAIFGTYLRSISFTCPSAEQTAPTIPPLLEVSHCQRYKKTLLISLVSVDPECGRTEREQNVLFHKRITF